MKNAIKSLMVCTVACTIFMEIMTGGSRIVDVVGVAILALLGAVNIVLSQVKGKIYVKKAAISDAPNAA